MWMKAIVVAIPIKKAIKISIMYMKRILDDLTARVKTRDGGGKTSVSSTASYNDKFAPTNRTVSNPSPPGLGNSPGA